MASSWLAWMEFEKPLKQDQPEYLKILYDTTRKISQEIVYADSVEGRNIRWDEARNRVMTLDFLERTANRFGKSHATIHGDVARIASHSSWLARTNRNGEYRILGDVIRELAECGGASRPEIAPPSLPPIIMTAIEIRRHVSESNVAFQRAQAEFLADEPPKAKTALFDFVHDVDRQARFADVHHRRKRPSKNWRKEIGI